MTRYANISFAKTLPMVFLAVGLSLAVGATFLWKESAYGGTPFFNSVRLLAEEQAVWGIFAARHASSQAAAALFSLVAPSAAAPAGGGAARAIPVLTYHRLTARGDGANVTIGNFMDHMQVLYAAGWRTVTLAQYQALMRGEIGLPEKSFLLTFDDGAQQSFYPVDPILKTLGFTAVAYIIVAGSETEKSTYYLSPAQIKTMLATGRWEIGSHSFDAHRPYRTDAEGGTGVFYSDKLWLSDKGRVETAEEFAKRVGEDLRESRAALEKTYDVPIRTFAFPFGGETGHALAGNFPGGDAIAIREASGAYDMGWVQTERKEYTFNYPAYRSFLGLRIHVDHDWDGGELLSVMENGIPKDLPWSDDMSKDRGWLVSWGNVRAGGALVLSANPGETSASTLLDGTRLWNRYETNVVASWQDGYAFVLGSAVGSRTYRACAFADGEVQLQDTAGETVTLAKSRQPSITSGHDIRLGMRVEADAVSCLYNGREVLRAAVSHQVGGIGAQVWNPRAGAASLTITEFSVEPL